jgi:CRISPR-associated endonuclease/helicase Cas3
MCLARPGETLLEHLNSVKNIGLEIYKEKKSLHFSIPNKLVLQALSNMLFYHDIGKSTVFFQDYMKASLRGAKYQGESDLADHALVSAVYSSYKTYVDTKSNLLSIIVFLAVRKHHGDFKNVKDMLSISRTLWEKIRKQWENMNFKCIEEQNTYDFESVKDYISDLLFDVDDLEKNMENYFLLNFFFSILTYSDKNDAKFGRRHQQTILPLSSYKWVDHYKSICLKPDNSVMNSIRESVYDSCVYNMPDRLEDKFIFSINAPTGSGKTLAGLNVALNILKKDKNMRRIIYCLPFTSIVEQTYDTIKKVISSNCEDPCEGERIGLLGEVTNTSFSSGKFQS